MGISCDSVYTLKDWAEHMKVTSFPFVSDFWPHGATARAYGVFNEQIGRPERAIFIVDRAGIVRYVDVHTLREVPDTAEIEEQLAKVT